MQSNGISALVFKKNNAHSIVWPKLSLLFVGPNRLVAVKNNIAECKSVADGFLQWLHFGILKLPD